MLRYDPHAEFQLARRGIDKAWVQQVVSAPDEREVRGDKLSLLASFPDRGRKLRIVVRLLDPEYVITAYFDRRKPCG